MRKKSRLVEVLTVIYSEFRYRFGLSPFSRRYARRNINLMMSIVNLSVIGLVFVVISAVVAFFYLRK